MNSLIPKIEINQSHPIYRFRDFLRERFPFEVRKLPLHTYLSCPHRDPEHGGGCIYCYEPAFSTLRPDLPDVQTQLNDRIKESRERQYRGKYIAYFQTGTNTYAPTELLATWWKSIEDYPEDIVGLAVGTRPDCLDDSVLELLADISHKMMVWLELGLQSARDATLERINRGHDYSCFVDAIDRIHQYPLIYICAHIILGLPGESTSDMLFTFNEINRLELDGVKIHHLQVVKQTTLENWFHAGKIRVFEELEYCDLLATLLPHLNSDIMVHRLVGDIKDDLLIAPRWRLPKTAIIQLIHQRLQERGTWQGKECR